MGDLFLQKTLVNLIRNLCHNKALATIFGRFNVHFSANRNGAASGFVCVFDTLRSHDDATRWEVRSRKHFHKLFRGDVGVVNHHAYGFGNLAQIVRRDVGGHANGNTRGTVYQEVWKTGREYGRLCQGLVVVWLHINGIFIEVGKHLHGGASQTSLGITHGCRWIAINGAKVTMTVNERQAHREVLRHTHHGIVNGRVSVWVILTHNFTDGPCGLFMRFIRGNTGFVHSIENAAVHWFKSVTHIRKCTGNDDGHGVLQERRAHFVGHVSRLKRTAMNVGKIKTCSRLIGNGVRHGGSGKAYTGLGIKLILTGFVKLSVILVIFVFALILIIKITIFDIV